MRILHLGKYAFERTGGIERHVEDLSIAQARQGAEVTVLSYSDDDGPAARLEQGVRVEPVKVLWSAGSQPVSLELVVRVRALIKHHAFDVVHMHWPDPWAHFICSLMPRGPVLVATWHSDIVRQRALGAVYRAIAPHMFRRPDAVIGATFEHLRSPQMAAFVGQERRHLIPFGIDTSSFGLSDLLIAQVARLTEKHGGEPIVFALGRHVYYKGFDVLIRAMQQVPGTLLLGGTGPLTPKLMRLADSLAQSSRGQVVFAGSIPEDELPVYYHACDVFCLPSVATTEAFGLVQTEAMACGKPIVNTLLGTGVNEVAPDGVCARTVLPGDDEALAGALNALIENPTDARALGARGRERVASLYNVDTMARKTRALYAQLQSEI